MDPAVQALPALAHTPALSSRTSSPSLSTPGKYRLEVFGKRSTGSPLTSVPEIPASTAFLEMVAQRPHGGQFLLHVRARQFGGFAERDDAGHVLRAAAPTVFLAAADQETA